MSYELPHCRIQDVPRATGKTRSIRCRRRIANRSLDGIGKQAQARLLRRLAAQPHLRPASRRRNQEGPLRQTLSAVEPGGIQHVARRRYGDARRLALPRGRRRSSSFGPTEEAVTRPYSAKKALAELRRHRRMETVRLRARMDLARSGAQRAGYRLFRGPAGNAARLQPVASVPQRGRRPHDHLRRPQRLHRDRGNQAPRTCSTPRRAPTSSRRARAAKSSGPLPTRRLRDYGAHAHSAHPRGGRLRGVPPCPARLSTAISERRRVVRLFEHWAT